MQDVQEALDTYVACRLAGDSAAWLANWDADGVQLFPGARASTMETLREVTPARFKAVAVTSFALETDDITVAGAYAFAHGHFILERVVEGAPVQVDGKFLTVLKMQPDGSWKIFRDCSNSNDH
jgi:ketosteroid isomerase-like protein